MNVLPFFWHSTFCTTPSIQKDITNYVHILAYFRTLWDEAAEEAVVKTDEATDRIGLRISSSDKHFVVVKNFE